MRFNIRRPGASIKPRSPHYPSTHIVLWYLDHTFTYFQSQRIVNKITAPSNHLLFKNGVEQVSTLSSQATVQIPVDLLVCADTAE